jgi:exopolyphosphatase/guanosine-5'-triphosphate,3'-diphosphate pyrophosphatase
VGAVRLTEQFGLAGPVTDEVLAEVADEIRDGFSRLDGRSGPDQLIGMGGAVTNLAAVRHGLTDYDPEVVHGTELDRDEVERQIGLYRVRDADDRRRDVVGLQPSRAEVILAGACIVRAVLERLGTDRLTVSDRGLRHGVLVDRFGL